MDNEVCDVPPTVTFAALALGEHGAWRMSRESAAPGCSLLKHKGGRLKGETRISAALVYF